MMNKSILSYDQFKKQRFSESNLHENELNEENIFTRFFNFLKGIFNLFTDKDIKKDSEDLVSYIRNSSKTFDDIEEIERELNPKKLRKYSSKLIEDIQKRINLDYEEAQKISSITSREVHKIYTGWLAMLVTYQTSIKLPVIQMMVKNMNLGKRFKWVPYHDREKIEKGNAKKFFDSTTALDTKIENSLVRLSKTPIEKMDSAIKQFATGYMKHVSENAKKLELLKNNDKKWLNNLLSGFHESFVSVMSTVDSLVKNTPDDQLSKLIAKKLMDEKSNKKPQQNTTTAQQ